MAALREYIERRREELRKQIAPLETQAADLRSKLGATDARLRVLTKEAAEIEKALQAIGRREKRKAALSIKDAVIQVLSNAPKGMTSGELLKAMNERYFDGQLLRTSMSPQLTRLKNEDKKIDQRGDRYFLI